jgi:hypothetical protein
LGVCGVVLADNNMPIASGDRANTAKPWAYAVSKVAAVQPKMFTCLCTATQPSDRAKTATVFGRQVNRSKLSTAAEN